MYSEVELWMLDMKILPLVLVARLHQALPVKQVKYNKIT